MQSQPYLLFSLNDSLYGVDSYLVQEVFYLPELTPAVEAPYDIVGLINLRGKVIPVMDLERRFGYTPHPYRLTDSIIILQWKSSPIGVLVHQVHEVKNLDASFIEAGIEYDRGESSKARFVSGLAKVDGEIITLLKLDKLLSDSNTLSLTNYDASDLVDGKVLSSGYSKQSAQPKPFFELCVDLKPDEKAIFQQRAANLRQSSASQDFTGLTPLAVIGLGKEYFGLDLKVVREFTDIRKPTPIPCCPAYIIGNMNLRGEIVTLIDVQSLLHVSRVDANAASQAMIVQVEDVVAGIAVDQVCDILYIRPSEIKPIPAAIHSEGDEFLRGTALYREKMMSILDLPKIFRQGNLSVNEEV